MPLDFVGIGIYVGLVGVVAILEPYQFKAPIST